MWSKYRTVGNFPPEPCVEWVRIPTQSKIKTPTADVIEVFMAEDEGSEFALELVIGCYVVLFPVMQPINAILTYRLVPPVPRRVICLGGKKWGKNKNSNRRIAEYTPPQFKKTAGVIPAVFMLVFLKRVQYCQAGSQSSCNGKSRCHHRSYGGCPYE